MVPPKIIGAMQESQKGSLIYIVSEIKLEKYYRAFVPDMHEEQGEVKRWPDSITAL